MEREPGDGSVVMSVSEGQVISREREGEREREKEGKESRDQSKKSEVTKRLGKRETRPTDRE